MAFIPAKIPDYPQYAPVNVSTTGDVAIVKASGLIRIVVTGYILDANGNDMVVTIKSGGASGGQSNTVLAQFTVGPTADVPGVVGQNSDRGHFATVLPVPPNVTPDDLVINVTGTGTILLTGHLTFELRGPAR
jgi:hypothetical protein